jgi:hypothetical protein
VGPTSRYGRLVGSMRAPRVRRKKRDEELEQELVPPQVIVGSDVMELVAWSWAESHQPGAVGDGKADAKEISLTTRSGEFSAGIYQHAQSGRRSRRWSWSCPAGRAAG